MSHSRGDIPRYIPYRVTFTSLLSAAEKSAFKCPNTRAIMAYDIDINWKRVRGNVSTRHAFPLEGKLSQIKKRGEGKKMYLSSWEPVRSSKAFRKLFFSAEQQHQPFQYSSDCQQPFRGSIVQYRCSSTTPKSYCTLSASRSSSQDQPSARIFMVN